MKTSDSAAGGGLPFFLGVSVGWGKSLVYRIYPDGGELLFLDVPWPDFDEQDFEAALVEFSRRDRRFGCIGATDSARAQHG